MDSFQVNGLGRAAYAVFFDLDGVLIDSLPDITSAVNYSLALHRLPSLSSAEIVAFVGHGARNLLHRSYEYSAETARRKETETAVRVFAVPPMGSPAFEAIHQEYVAYYSAHSAEKTILYPGAASLLATLRESGVPVALISNKPYAVILGALKNLHIVHYFDVIVDPDNVGHIKPAPDALAVALKCINGKRAAAGKPDIKNSECLMVGDTDTDIMAGKAFGSATAAVTGGYGDKDALLSQGADLVVRFVAELAG